MLTHPTETSRLGINLDGSLSEPLYKQLYGRIRGAILSGQLQPGARLPSTRALASELSVSRSTTVLAYELLLLEGYVDSQVGRGTKVSPDLPQTLLDRREPADRTAPPAGAFPRLADRVQRVQTVPAALPFEGPGGGAFTSGMPALDCFPYSLWARLLARRARRSLAQHGYYQLAAGYHPLREAIAAHIGISRGVRCTAEQIIVTAGTQGAFDLAIRTLIEPGDAVWLENPGYFGALAALTLAGAQLVPVPVDGQGLNIAAGRQRCPDARLVAVTPSHQFPTGVRMGLERRLELLAWARQRDAWILEDDYDSEFRFSGHPLEALHALDRTGRVLYIGSFSKVLLPSLRLGYLVVPPELVQPLLAARRGIDVHPPILEQLALTDFIEEGHFARHLRRMRQLYRRRRACLQHELTRQLDGLLDVYLPQTGMELVGWLPEGVDDRRAAELATAAGLWVAPVSRFSLEPLPRGGLLLGFGGVDEDAIVRGVQTLADALERL